MRQPRFIFYRAATASFKRNYSITRLTACRFYLIKFIGVTDKMIRCYFPYRGYANNEHKHLQQPLSVFTTPIYPFLSQTLEL